jgi:hypothetical protein
VYLFAGGGARRSTESAREASLRRAVSAARSARFGNLRPIPPPSLQPSPPQAARDRGSCFSLRHTHGTRRREEIARHRRRMGRDRRIPGRSNTGSGARARFFYRAPRHWDEKSEKSGDLMLPAAPENSFFLVLALTSSDTIAGAYLLRYAQWVSKRGVTR